MVTTPQYLVRTGQNASTRYDWRDQAICTGEDPELFFPIGAIGPGTRAQTELARAVCNRCPVRPACLNLALRANIDYGMWGGLDENERRTLTRQRRETPTPEHRRPPTNPRSA